MSNLQKFLNVSRALLRGTRFRQLDQGLARLGVRRSLSSQLQLNVALADVKRLGTEVKFVYFSSISGEEQTLMQKLDCSGIRIAPLSVFSQVASTLEQESRFRAVCAEPDLFRRVCLRVLLQLPQTVRGVLFATDTSPELRQLVHACKDAQVPSILLPLDGSVDDARYYVDAKTALDYPICDRACVWNPIAARVLRERGFPEERLTLLPGAAPTNLDEPVIASIRTELARLFDAPPPLDDSLGE